MESLIEFYAIVIDAWNNAGFGANFGRIVLGVGAIMLSVLVRRLFAKFVIAWVKRLTTKTKTEFDDRTIDALQKPLRFVFVVFWFDSIDSNNRES